jgi:hypothetical protein
VQHDWEQFELLASELAAQLAAALQPKHSAQHHVGPKNPHAQLVPTSAPPVELEAEQPQQKQQQQQQQQQVLVEWLGGAGLAPAAAAAAAEALSGGAGPGGVASGLHTGAELSDVLSKLMEAPLAAR